MICSTSFFRVRCLAVVFVLALSGGCATVSVNDRSVVEVASPRPKIAVFPVQNLSGGVAPLAEIRAALVGFLEVNCCEVVGEKELQAVMAAERVRNVGGITGPLAIKMHEAIGADSVLITSLELYNEQFPPKISLLARLVSLTDPPVILWMDSVGLAGDEAPGILGLGLITQPDQLRDKALRTLVSSLKAHLTGEKASLEAAGRFYPKMAYGTVSLDAEKKYRIAVTTFFNFSDRKYAGELMALHFVDALQKFDNIEVIEPGIVLEEMLRFRIIMEDGFSKPAAGNLFVSLKPDFVFSGKVFDYQDYAGEWGMPVVDFSTEMIDGQNREVVWTSKSYNAGSDGVFFFDWGRVTTARTMASGMARAISGLIAQ